MNKFVDFTGDYLLTDEPNGRMMLRGFFYWPISDGKFFTFTEVAPFIKNLIAESYDMYNMPKVPEAKKKIGNYSIYIF